MRVHATEDAPVGSSRRFQDYGNEGGASNHGRIRLVGYDDGLSRSHMRMDNIMKVSTHDLFNSKR